MESLELQLYALKKRLTIKHELKIIINLTNNLGFLFL